MELLYGWIFFVLVPDTPQGDSGSGLGSSCDEGNLQMSDSTVHTFLWPTLSIIRVLFGLTYLCEKQVSPFSPLWETQIEYLETLYTYTQENVVSATFLEVGSSLDWMISVIHADKRECKFFEGCSSPFL